MDEVLRLGVDPRPAEEGYRRHQEATKKTAAEVQRLSSTIEQQARRDTDVYRRAAAERTALERQLATQRSAQYSVSGTAAAEAFVRAQEGYYRTAIARIREAQARGMMTPADAAQAGRQAAQAYNSAVVTALDRQPQYQRDRGAYTLLAGSLKNLDEGARSGSLGMHRLNNSLVVLARQATGTHPVVGQLADVVGTFAIGTAAMVPVLAGIAALAAGWRFLTRDAREAKEALEGALEVLENIARERETQREGGPTQATLNIVSRELAKLQAEAEAMRQIMRTQPGTDAAVFAGARLGANQREQQALFEKQLAGIAEREEELAGERSEERRANLALRNRVNAAARAYDDLTEQIRALTEAANRQRAQIMGRIDEPMFLRALRGPDYRSLSGQNPLWVNTGPGDLSGRIEESAKRTLRTLERQREAEQELERTRDRANRALVRSLENIGRAYGGVVDQVLSLVAATLALERMPMVSAGDKARAYGSAALAGIGYGVSSGSPAIGAAGGALSGFAVAGPMGALVGGVTGIVSGLIEQGERAQRAAAQWRIALRDFEDMFTEFTPFEQAQRQIERQFLAVLQQYGGRGSGFAGAVSSVEEARALYRQLSGSELGRNQFGDLIRELGALLTAYDRNVDAAQEQIDATEDNTNAMVSLTSALNAPSGLRLSYLEWLSAGVLPPGGSTSAGPSVGPTGSGTGTSGGGSGPNGNRGDVYHIYVTAGAGATLDGVVAEAQKRARRGGGDPFFTVRA